MFGEFTQTITAVIIIAVIALVAIFFHKYDGGRLRSRYYRTYSVILIVFVAVACTAVL